MSQQNPNSENSSIITKLLASVVIMFAFGFALVPLYEKFCDLTGFNGTTKNTAAAEREGMQVDESRWVTVEFTTRADRGAPWSFRPEVRSVRMHPGEIKVVNFIVDNHSSTNRVAQALPSVSPGEASLYLNKTECFCFEQQPLTAGETAVMPMRFFLDPDLPQEIQRLTLSYVMYDITDQAQSGQTASRSE
ncbi:MULTISPECIES: cytochrome c oxidase assembly protein [Gammaproteobacteria]|uniref:cytochrome c oxidase assembly protein n=1 Tax=Gammaproteobacteria TaxID=1236 RepID=UPI000DD0CEC9|nr:MULTISPECIES: cytochrome c oxidase assembly protein [Gammaproteobacteria]RTE86477.1 cytochrome c oxidase assembly protein [Aliidiomarina sp. B3213]TCZ90968.1 cytochrome c oxidase assembly protein [Lysobacter sp. N42]